MEKKLSKKKIVKPVLTYQKNQKKRNPECRLPPFGAYKIGGFPNDHRRLITPGLIRLDAFLLV